MYSWPVTLQHWTEVVLPSIRGDRSSSQQRAAPLSTAMQSSLETGYAIQHVSPGDVTGVIRALDFAV